MSEQLDKLQVLIQKLSFWESTIKEAIAHGRNTHSFDDIIGMVLQNRVLFFSYEKAFVIMEKVDYPQFSTFHCFLAGGDLHAVLAAQPEMEAIGVKLGCKYLSMSGRKGWQQSLSDLGWSHVCTTMYRPIGELANEQREGRKETTTVKLPKDIEDAAKANLELARSVGALPYAPYFGGSVAAFSPGQMAGFGGMNQAASAFGLPGQAGQGLPAPQNMGGISAYSTEQPYNAAMDKVDPRVLELYNSFFFPNTGGNAGGASSQLRSGAPTVNSVRKQTQKQNKQSLVRAFK